MAIICVQICGLLYKMLIFLVDLIDSHFKRMIHTDEYVCVFFHWYCLLVCLLILLVILFIGGLRLVDELIPTAAALATSALRGRLLKVHSTPGTSTSTCTTLWLVLRQFLCCIGDRNMAASEWCTEKKWTETLCWEQILCCCVIQVLSALLVRLSLCNALNLYFSGPTVWKWI